MLNFVDLKYILEKYSIYTSCHEEQVLCSKMNRTGGIRNKETNQAQRQLLRILCHRWKLGSVYLKVGHAHKDKGCWC